MYVSIEFQNKSVYSKQLKVGFQSFKIIDLSSMKCDYHN